MHVRTSRDSPGGLSVPQGRTVHSYVFHTTRDEHRLWYNFEKGRRTVRALGADRLPFILEIHQRQQCLWYKLSNGRRTVRGTGFIFSAEFRRNFGFFSFPLVTGIRNFGIFRYISFQNSKFNKFRPKSTEISEQNFVSAKHRDFIGKRNG